RARSKQRQTTYDSLVSGIALSFHNELIAHMTEVRYRVRAVFNLILCVLGLSILFAVLMLQKDVYLALICGVASTASILVSLMWQAEADRLQHALWDAQDRRAAAADGGAR
ncbi:MAG: hypothetical protein LAO07_15750, partial [Acidobacteriia bacterium]|nr:hypothetical protein [Terriglobia bacterium]